MFAVSALSVQNVNAQNETTVKNQPNKENVKQDAKQTPAKPTQAINEPKVKEQQNQENAQKGAPIHKVKGNNSSKKTMTRETTMKKENNQSQQNVKGDPQMKDMQKPGQKNDAKAETKKASEPTMRSAQPQQKNDVQARPKQVKPDYNKTGKTTLKPTQENVTRPKMKKEQKTVKAGTNDIK